MAGMILGIPILRALLFDSDAIVAIDTLSILGIVFLLFLAGLEIDLKYLRKTAKDSVMLGLAASLTPMLLGFLALIYLGYTVSVALVFGICLAITAGGTIVGVLMDLNVVNTKLGTIFVAAGTVDDILEILLLSLITLLVQGGNPTQLALLPLQFLAFIAIIFALFKLLEKVMPYIKVHSELEGSNVELFSIAIIILISLATLSELLQLGYLVGAIVAGFLLQYSMRNVSLKNRTEIIEQPASLHSLS